MQNHAYLFWRSLILAACSAVFRSASLLYLACESAAYLFDGNGPDITPNCSEDPVDTAHVGKDDLDSAEARGGGDGMRPL